MLDIPAHSAYFIFSCLFIIPWVIFYCIRPDLRREMILMSILIAILQPFIEYFWWTKDWWKPLTITDTLVGIEDVILGFTNGGIVAVLYEVFWKKRFTETHKQKLKNHGHFYLVLVVLTIIAVLFWIMGVTSFWATTVALTVGSLVIFRNRHDLVTDAIASGFLMLITVLPAYLFVIWAVPGFVQTTYLWHGLSGILVEGIPIEELVFYFLFGFAGGPFYEYWKGLHFQKATLKRYRFKGV